MFEETLMPRSKTRSAWTVLLAFAAQLAIVGIVLVLVPAQLIKAPPKEEVLGYIVAPPPPPPASAPAHAKEAEKFAPETVHSLRVFQPPFIPKTIPQTQEVLQPPQAIAGGAVAGVPGGVPGGQPGGVIGGTLGGTGGVPPPPPPPPKPVAPKRIRVGGAVQAAKLVHKVVPEYPPLAKSARIQGMVRLAALIDTQGRIRSLRVIDGHPLLVPAALQAVRQWVYKPTLLNGSPAEVSTEIDVTFVLS